MKTGIELITEERKLQLEKWSGDHDDECHRYAILARYAAVLAVAGTDARVSDPDDLATDDPWGLLERYPEHIKRLQIAGALIAAEIDHQLRRQEEDNNEK